MNQGSFALLGALTVGICGPTHLALAQALTDRFGRNVAQHAVVVPEWEGYMANPAIELTLTPPAKARAPVTATLTSSEPRLYFDLPSTIGPKGPTKVLRFPDDKGESFFVAVFPARVKRDFESTLTVAFVDAAGVRSTMTVPVHVRGVVKAPANERSHPILFDYSHDTTGFFADAERKRVVEQAAADWQFYLADMDTDAVQAGSTRTYIWNAGEADGGNWVPNKDEFRGTMMYLYGRTMKQIRSGGAPDGDAQTSRGKPLAIHRTANVNIDPRGNYNLLGWSVEVEPARWWETTNLGHVKNDLYSIARHEMGHALFFNPKNTKFPRKGTLSDKALDTYQGRSLATDPHDHFDGVVDPSTLHGAFGNEYHGRVPHMRWLITPTDLLAAQAVGYTLKSVGPLRPLTLSVEGGTSLAVGSRPSLRVAALGGIALYDWQITRGKLPTGLALNRFTGAIEGSPREAGEFKCTVGVQDGSLRPLEASQDLTLIVR